MTHPSRVLKLDMKAELCVLASYIIIIIIIIILFYAEGHKLISLTFKISRDARIICKLM